MSLVKGETDGIWEGRKGREERGERRVGEGIEEGREGRRSRRE